jgi:hypothetical protein
MKPTISNVKRNNGIAGQYTVSATVQYPGEAAETVTFVGSTYGGPIVMVTPSGVQTFVSADVVDRIGATLTPEWVERFFA